MEELQSTNETAVTEYGRLLNNIEELKKLEEESLDNNKLDQSDVSFIQTACDGHINLFLTLSQHIQTNIVILNKAQSGPQDNLEVIPQTNVNVDGIDDHGKTELMIAAKDGKLDTLITLLQNGANINKVDKDGWTPLFFATCNQQLQIVSELLQRGADVKIRAYNGKTALEMAEILGAEEIVNVLKTHAKNASITFIKTPIGSQSVKCTTQSKYVMDLLTLCNSALEAHITLVQKLLNNVAVVNVDENDNNKLPNLSKGQLTCAEGIKEIRRILANVDKTDHIGWTPLLYASCYGDLGKVEELLGMEADVNIAGLRGETLTDHGHLQIVRTLLENKANINIVDKDGWSALLYATFCKHLLVVRELIRRGAKKSVKSHSGVTALQLALQLKYPDIENELKKRKY